MKKYGNMGGWKAIRTLNRDARIASGQSPYGYKARYSSRTPGNLAAELRWDVVANRNRSKASQIYQEAFDYLTAAERQEVEGLIQNSSRLTEVGEAELQAAQRSFFFRDLRVSRWSAKWSVLYVEDAERFLATCRRISIISEDRASRLKENEASLVLFLESIEALFCARDQTEESKKILEAAEREILSEACRSGIVEMNEGQYALKVSDWDDIVVKRNKIIELVISFYSNLIRSNEQWLMKRRVKFKLVENGRQLTFRRKTIKVSNLSP